MVAVGMKKIADELDAVGFNFSEDNYKALRANIQTGWFMGQKHLQQRIQEEYFHQSVSGYKVISHGVTMDSQIMEMTVLVGVKRQLLHGHLTVTMLAMLVNSFGRVRTISVNQLHATKTTRQLKALTLVS